MNFTGIMGFSLSESEMNSANSFNEFSESDIINRV